MARTIPEGMFWKAAPGGVGERYDQLRAALGAAQVPVTQLVAGDLIPLSGGVSLKVLSPRAATQRSVQDMDEMGMNKDSLVFRLVYGSFSMLFAADAGFPTEARKCSDGYELKSTVLKVGHHGSRYSTSDDFLKLVDPQLAMISAGRGNRFGLPSSDTLLSLHRQGGGVLRTDLDGTLELVSDGRTWSASSPYPPD